MGQSSGRSARTRGERYAAEKALAEYKRHKVRGNRGIAEMTGLSLATVNTFFNGSRWPNPDTLWSLEEPLGWAPGDIQRLADNYDAGKQESIEFTPQNDLERAILRSNMSDDEKRSVLAQLWSDGKRLHNAQAQDDMSKRVG